MVKNNVGNPPPIFDGMIDYQRWKSRLEDCFEGHNLWTIVTADLLKGQPLKLLAATLSVIAQPNT
jgi:hypothetical protein